jgi:spore germination cell wall hydrolase CwlJ-like protein|tara:strand:- start:125 stop:664 length:540 start_codon:yes stop_codon:yes gene_type:complete
MRTFLGAVALFLSFSLIAVPPQAGDASKVIIIKVPEVAKILIDKKELDCMASNIYFEAATQSRIGKIAVAQVTMNRVRSPLFPNSVCDVVYQGPKNPKNTRLCQFSWFCDGKPDTIRSKRVWRESVYIAKSVILGGVPDITLMATHYHANYVNPWWAKKMRLTVSYGDHIFYRQRKYVQ